MRFFSLHFWHTLVSLCWHSLVSSFLYSLILSPIWHSHVPHLWTFDGVLSLLKITYFFYLLIFDCFLSLLDTRLVSLGFLLILTGFLCFWHYLLFISLLMFACFCPRLNFTLYLCFLKFDVVLFFDVVMFSPRFGTRFFRSLLASTAFPSILIHGCFFFNLLTFICFIYMLAFAYCVPFRHPSVPNL